MEVRELTEITRSVYIFEVDLNAMYNHVSAA